MTSGKQAGEHKLVASNKKAYHDYFVLDKFEAGLMLTGTEVKSLRDGRANLKDSYVLLKNSEAFLLGMHISPYSHGNQQNHEADRTRKLLLHRKEIDRLSIEVTHKGLSVVPLQIYFKGGRVKIEIAVVKGKKVHDKRDTEKQKEAAREVSAEMKKMRN